MSDDKKPPAVDLKPLLDELDRLRHEISTLRFAINNQNIHFTAQFQRIMKALEKKP
jgi:hypothetical protein